MTDKELRQEIENLVRQQEHSLTPCDPIDYGRRFARETFEKRMKTDSEGHQQAAQLDS